MKALADLLFGKGLLPGSWTAVFLLCPHTVEKARDLSGFSFIRALIPFMIYLPKSPPPNTITLGVRSQHVNSEGGHSQLITCSLFNLLTYFLFLMLFISLCVLKFLFRVIFFPPERLTLVFLARQFC